MRINKRIQEEMKPIKIETLTPPGFDLEGHKRGTTYHDMLEIILGETPDVFQKKMEAYQNGDYSPFSSQKEIVVRLAVQRSLLGDQKALDFIADREEGKVTQSFTLQRGDGKKEYVEQLRLAMGIGQQLGDGNANE